MGGGGREGGGREGAGPLGRGRFLLPLSLSHLEYDTHLPYGVRLELILKLTYRVLDKHIPHGYILLTLLTMHSMRKH